MYGSESPGSIRNQIGRSLNAIRECVEAEDDYGAANHFRLLVAFTSPHTTEEQRKKMIVVRDADDDPERTFNAVFAGIEVLMPILASQGLFTWTRGEPGEWEEGEEAGDPNMLQKST